MKTSTSLLVLALLASFTASAAPVSAEQKAAVRETMDSLSRIQGAVDSALAKGSGPIGDTQAKAMQKVLTEAFESKKCVSEGSTGVMTNDSAPQSFKFSGEGCPVLMESHSQFSPTLGGSVEGTIKGSYSVKEAEFRSLNDVDAYDMNATFSWGVVTSGSESILQKIESKVSMSTSLHSQKRGKIEMTMNTTMTVLVLESGATPQSYTTLTFKIGDGSVELGAGSPDGKSWVYMANGESVTLAELKEYLGENLSYLGLASAEQQPQSQK